MDEPLRFEWDPAKNAINQAKHGVSFEEASFAFFDPNGILIADPDHSEDEDRFLLLGRSAFGVLVVAHSYRTSAIRIISARKANGIERRVYLEGLT